MVNMPTSRKDYYGHTIEFYLAMLQRRFAVPVVSALIFFVIVALYRLGPSTEQYSSSALGNKRGFDGRWNYKRDANNLLLDSQQCDQAFPGLFEEVERPVRDRLHTPITVEELDSVPRQNGYVRAMIYDQQLYVIATTGSIYSREIATLHAIHRAILSSPEPIPNIEFAFNTDDRIPSVALWGYARQAEDTNIWLIPDFGYWSWPETKVGSLQEVQMKAISTEEIEGFQWSKKVQKLIWRGATMGLELRERFLEVTANKSWADVKALHWREQESMTHDLKSMPEHCQYKYVAHTEGNTYSGRLKYLQNCKSVVVAHEMSWIQHHHPLMRPSGPEQNFVEVERSYDNLEETISWLQKNDKMAQRIASNSVKVFRERYLTPAAEVCYWRKLFHGWAQVSFEPEFYEVVDGEKVWRGLPVESFLLERRLKWDPY